MTSCLFGREKDSLALFSNLKQKLQFCKPFVNGDHKHSWDTVLFAH